MSEQLSEKRKKSRTNKKILEAINEVVNEEKSNKFEENFPNLQNVTRYACIIIYLHWP